MILIHGKINNTQVQNSGEGQSIEFTFKDNSKHKYLFKDNTIFFIVTEQEIEKKYIALCESIDSCTFVYNSNSLKTTVKVGEILYNNNFTI